MFASFLHEASDVLSNFGIVLVHGGEVNAAIFSSFQIDEIQKLSLGWVEFVEREVEC